MYLSTILLNSFSWCLRQLLWYVLNHFKIWNLHDLQMKYWLINQIVCQYICDIVRFHFAPVVAYPFHSTNPIYLSPWRSYSLQTFSAALLLPVEPGLTLHENCGVHQNYERQLAHTILIRFWRETLCFWVVVSAVKRRTSPYKLYCNFARLQQKVLIMREEIGEIM